MSKTTKKQEPTKAEEVISRSEKFVESNITKIVIVLLVLVAIVAGFLAYKQFFKNPQNEKAKVASFVAEDRFMSGQDSAALYGADGEIGALEIAKKYSGTESSNLSHAYAGILYYDMGQYEDALRELKKFSSKEKMVAPSITRLIGDCYVELDKPQDAIRAFEKAAKDASNDAISPSCLIKAGHVYESLKQYDKALAAYQQVVDLYYTAPESESVKAEIIRVKAAMQ